MKKYIVNKTNVFNRWFKKLPKPIKLRITQRLERIKDGNLGDNKWFGDIGEFRFFFGSGYRIYYTIQGNQIILLLCGGDKSSQSNDIQKAREILKIIEN